MLGLQFANTLAAGINSNVGCRFHFESLFTPSNATTLPHMPRTPRTKTADAVDNAKPYKVKLPETTSSAPLPQSPYVEGEGSVIYHRRVNPAGVVLDFAYYLPNGLPYDRWEMYPFEGALEKMHDPARAGATEDDVFDNDENDSVAAIIGSLTHSEFLKEHVVHRLPTSELDYFMGKEGVFPVKTKSVPNTYQPKYRHLGPRHWQHPLLFPEWKEGAKVCK